MLMSDQPIFVGISGPAGSGKTTTGNILAPTSMMRLHPPLPKELFGHYNLSYPLYEFVGLKRNTQGDNLQSRVMYAMHDILLDLTLKYPSYDDLVELVYDIYHMDAGREGDPKPRTFMQSVGDMCRNAYADCFVDATIRKVHNDYRDIKKDYEEMDLVSPFYFTIISDIRRTNEVEVLQRQTNFVLIRLEASRETLERRLYDRDGVTMSPEEWDHATETEANEFPEEWFDLILNTDTMSQEEQAEAVKDFLMGLMRNNRHDKYNVRSVNV